MINSYITGFLFAKLVTKQYAIHIQLKPQLSATQIRPITSQVPGDCLLNTGKTWMITPDYRHNVYKMFNTFSVSGPIRVYTQNYYGNI